MLTNYHSHTTRCNHASATEREIVETAVRLGFSVMGFSDHSPQFFKKGVESLHRMSPSQLPEYVDSIKKLQKEYGSKISIPIGLEVEYNDQLFPLIYKYAKQCGVEYFILGQHWVTPDKDLAKVFHPTDDIDFLNKYTENVIKGLETGKFSCVAHADIINFTGKKELLKQALKEICTRAKELSVPIEVNFQGYATGRHYPGELLYETVKACQNEVVIGMDIHGLDMFKVDELLKLKALLCERGINVIDELKLKKL